MTIGILVRAVGGKGFSRFRGFVILRAFVVGQCIVNNGVYVRTTVIVAIEEADQKKA